MKKFLLVLVIGATFAACNDNATTETPATGDSSAMMAPAVDSPSTMSVDTSKMSMDTSKMAVDSPKTK